MKKSMILGFDCVKVMSKLRHCDTTITGEMSGVGNDEGSVSERLRDGVFETLDCLAREVR